MDSNFPLYNLFVKYIEGNCSPEEIRQLLLYFDDSEHEQILESLIRAEIGFINNEDADDRKISSALNNVRARLLDQIKKQDLIGKEGMLKRTFKIQTWMSIAALWFIFIVSAALILNYYIKSDTRPSIYKIVVSQQGERKVLHLFDGTKIWLSPSSTIKYRDQLVNNYREVTLDGEAFFEVAKDKAHPFIIHSGRMQTEVVGTSFNVKSYSKQNVFNVTVVTGIVKVSMLSEKKKKLSEVILKPKQQAIYNIAQATLAEEIMTTVVPVLKKKDGILSYDGSPVPEVVADLRRYYNQTIELENKSATCLCFGEFDTTKPIGTVLRQLATAIGATVRQTDNGYFLEGGCSD